MIYLKETKKTSNVKNALRNADCVMILRPSGRMYLGTDNLLLCVKYKYGMEDTFIDKATGTMYTVIKRYWRQNGTYMQEERFGNCKPDVLDVNSLPKKSVYPCLTVA